MPKTTLTSMRVTRLKLDRMYTAGAHVGEQLLLQNKSYDPALRPQMAPLQRYHREVWIWQFPDLRPEDALNIKELNEAFNLAKKAFSNGKASQ